MWGGGGGQELIPFLRVYKDGEVIDTLCLQSKDSWVLGRHGDCDIWVGHSSISRVHAEIEVLYATLELLLTDLQSGHGTRVNGKLVEGLHPCLLKANDEIQLGDFSRVYKVEWVRHSEAGEYLAETEAVSVGSVLSLDSLQTITDRVLEHPSDSGSKANFVHKLTQGRRSGSRRNSRKQTGCATNYQDDYETETRTMPEQPLNLEESGTSGARVFQNNVSTSATKQQTNKNTVVATPVQDENDIPSARKQSNRTDGEASLCTSARRLAFTTLQPSDLNVRSGNKANGPTSDKHTPTKARAIKKLTPIKVTTTYLYEDEALLPSNLPLQRSSSLPLPSRVTPPVAKPEVRSDKEHVEVLSPLEANALEEGDTLKSALEKLALEKFGPDEDYYHDSDKENANTLEEGDTIESALEKLELEKFGPDEDYYHDSDKWNANTLEEGDSIESALEKLALEKFGADEDNHHDSDKENSGIPENTTPGPGSAIRMRGSDMVRTGQRVPFQPLHIGPSPSSSAYRPVFTPMSASSASSYGAMRSGVPLPYRQAAKHEEVRRQWHIVVDTNCLLKTDALRSLKQLEGIRETRLIIPKIVVRELDSLRRQQIPTLGASLALQWIEECMVKLPFWIHVQSSLETLQTHLTPPPSPSEHSRGFIPYMGVGDLMTCTLHDHILECAMLIHENILDGAVALLTDDTALKIKAMAEGLIVDNVTDFSEGLLSPYSERFLYTGSTPLGRSNNQRGISTPSSTTSSSDSRTRDFILHSAVPSPRPGTHWKDDFRSHHFRQPLGLQVLLS